ncbi:hypothetical protein BX070DRAFT_152754 [Coemansia spiralis]|nr:hypothetical protein BX070DRAFT_152754 [Coemansia spiralis]
MHYCSQRIKKLVFYLQKENKVRFPLSRHVIALFLFTSLHPRFFNKRLWACFALCVVVCLMQTCLFYYDSHTSSNKTQKIKLMPA